MPVKAMSLAELQARLFSLITARDSIDQELRATNFPITHVTDCVVGDDKLDAVGRLDIYNSMYFLRLLEDVLQVDYPTVLAVLGTSRFETLASDYLQACRPNQPSIREASARLPGFVAEWATRQSAPVWLASVADLEWARVDVFDDADDSTLEMQHLQTQAPEALPLLQLRTVRAHRLVNATHDVASVWRAVDDDFPQAEPAATPQMLLVWRQDGVVYHREVDDKERLLLPLMVNGISFGQMCEHLGEHTDEVSAAQTAVQLLSQWVHDGVLIQPP